MQQTRLESKKFSTLLLLERERERVESICQRVSSAAKKFRVKKFLYSFIIGERERELRVFVDFKFRLAD